MLPDYSKNSMILRSALLFLSRQKQLRRWVESSEFSQKLTRRFVAGKTLEEGLGVCARLNAEGILATLDHLGENVPSVDEASRTRDAYLEALRQIFNLHLKATVSVKLTHFGLDFSEEHCREYVADVVAEAQRCGNSVEIDMESLQYVDPTLRIVASLHERFGCVRAVIQAYLRRSEADIRMLNGRRIPVRLCKGAYRESADVSFTERLEVDENYLRLAELLISEGPYPAMATHDERIIRDVIKLVRERDYPPDRMEFQMLFGIRKSLQHRLVRDGFAVRLYVPYGVAWYPYLVRRLAERPANLFFLAKNVFRN